MGALLRREGGHPLCEEASRHLLQGLHQLEARWLLLPRLLARLLPEHAHFGRRRTGRGRIHVVPLKAAYLKGAIPTQPSRHTHPTRSFSQSPHGALTIGAYTSDACTHVTKVKCDSQRELA